MASLRDIKRKIGSVKNTQKITSAMKMVSAAKMKKAQEAMSSARPYAVKIKEVVANIGKRVSSDAHPYLEVRENVENIGVLVITSDRGLCGAFNSSVIKEFNRFAEEHKNKNLKVFCVGKTGNNAILKTSAEILESYLEFSGRIIYDDAIGIGDVVTKTFTEGTIDELYIIYNEYKSVTLQVPKVSKVMPLIFEENTEEDNDSIDYIYEPKPELLLA